MSMPIFVLLVFFAQISCTYADMYSYTDEQGKICIVNNLDSVPDRYRDSVEVFEMDETYQPPPRRKPEKRSTKKTRGFSLGDMFRRDTRQPANQAVNDQIGKEEEWQRKVRSKRITVFIRQGCPYCVKLIQFLDANEIDYELYDLEKNWQARQIFKNLGGTGVPLTTVDDYVIRGYNPRKILKAIASD